MNKNYLNIILFMCALNISLAQKITVKDNNNLQPIEGVQVYTNDDKYIGSTNAKGEINIFESAEKYSFSHVSYQKKTITRQEIEKNNFVIFLTPQIHLLNEYTVSSNRFELKHSLITQSIKTLDKTEINNLNPQTTADLLQNSSVAFVQKSQMGGGSPIIRGFEANKILLVVDGIRMNNAIYRGGHLQNIITVDPNSLQRVEILEGPGSLLYGSDALGGTIYMETINPSFNDSNKLYSKGNVLFKTATANFEKTAHTDVILANNRIASVTSVTFSDFDDLRQGANRNPFYGDWGKRLFYVERINNTDSIIKNQDPNIQVGSAYWQYDLLQKIKYKATENNILTGCIQFSNSSNVPRYDRLTLTQNGIPRFAEWYYGPQKRLLTYVKWENSNANLLFDKFTLTPSYQNIEESRHDRKFNNVKKNHRIETLNIYSLNADFFKQIKQHNVIYGLEYNHEQVDSKANKENIVTGETEPLDTRYPDGGSTMNRFSAFFKHSVSFNNKFWFNEGIRYNVSSLNSKFIDTTFYHFIFDEITQKNNAFTFNVGLGTLITKYLSTTINYSKGYRTPNVDDLSKIFESVPGTVTMPNEKLKPEYTHTFAFGLKYNNEQKLNWSINVFYTLYRNIITLEPGTFNGMDSVMYNGQLSKVLMNVNKDEAYLYGAYAQLIIPLNLKLYFIGTATYTYGRIKTDTTDYPLDHIPPVYGKLGFKYKDYRFSSEINMLFNGWKFKKDYNLIGEDNFTYATEYGMPAWITFNIYTQYQINKFVQLHADIENILDQNYRVFSSNISAPGRSFKFGIRILW